MQATYRPAYSVYPNGAGYSAELIWSFGVSTKFGPFESESAAIDGLEAELQKHKWRLADCERPWSPF